jgi:hypothetical protein
MADGGEKTNNGGNDKKQNQQIQQDKKNQQKFEAAKKQNIDTKKRKLDEINDDFNFLNVLTLGIFDNYFFTTQNVNEDNKVIKTAGFQSCVELISQIIGFELYNSMKKDNINVKKNDPNNFEINSYDTLILNIKDNFFLPDSKFFKLLCLLRFLLINGLENKNDKNDESFSNDEKLLKNYLKTKKEKASRSLIEIFNQTKTFSKNFSLYNSLLKIEKKKKTVNNNLSENIYDVVKFGYKTIEGGSIVVLGIPPTDMKVLNSDFKYVNGDGVTTKITPKEISETLNNLLKKKEEEVKEKSGVKDKKSGLFPKTDIETIAKNLRINRNYSRKNGVRKNKRKINLDSSYEELLPFFEQTRHPSKSDDRKMKDPESMKWLEFGDNYKMSTEYLNFVRTGRGRASFVPKEWTMEKINQLFNLEADKGITLAESILRELPNEFFARPPATSSIYETDTLN